MKNTFSRQALLSSLLVSVLLLPACGSIVADTFNIGGSEADHGFSYRTADVISVNGMHPMRGVGEVYYTGSTTTHMRGVGVVKGPCQIVTEIYPSAADKAEVEAIRIQLIRVKQAMATEVAAKAKQVRDDVALKLLQVAEKQSEDKKGAGATPVVAPAVPPAAVSAPPNAANAGDPAKPEKKEEKGESAAAVKHLGDLSEKIKAIAAAAEEAQPVKPTAAEAAMKKLKEKKNELVDSVATAPMGTLQEEVAVYERLMKPGIVVWRWAIDAKGKLSLSAEPLAAVRAQKTSASSGYLIASGISVSRLMVGTDPIWVPQKMNTDNFEVPVFAISAKHIAWTVDSESALAVAASVKLDKDVIKALGAGGPAIVAALALKLESVQGDIEFAQSRLMGSCGQLGDPQIKAENIEEASGLCPRHRPPNATFLPRAPGGNCACPKGILIFTRSVNLYDLLRSHRDLRGDGHQEQKTTDQLLLKNTKGQSW